MCGAPSLDDVASVGADPVPVAGTVPAALDRAVLCVSGRIGFEIVQKAVVARVPVVVAVVAPSSLAVDLARGYGVTLAGFARGERMVVYSSSERLV